MNQPRRFDFLSGEVLLLNKPPGWTSFDVVNKIRFAIRKYYGISRIKIGHAGTLDPLATGLLIVCTGKKTRAISLYQGMNKTYSGIIRLGATTPSFDLETSVDKVYSYSHVAEQDIKLVMNKMTGQLEQIPPVFSAVKIEGKRAYQLARNQELPTISARIVFIHSFNLLHYEPPDVYFRVECSKGTYIRALARDMGIVLNTGAHLVELKREQIGDYNLESAWELPILLSAIATSTDSDN